MARQLGYTETELEALDHAGPADPFDPALRAALVYAERMTRDAHSVTDKIFENLKKHYSSGEIVELSSVIGLTNYWNRFTAALRIDLSGTDEPYDS